MKKVKCIKTEEDAMPDNERCPYLVGQQVLLGKREIGTIVAPERADLPNTAEDMWVFSPIRGYASRYNVLNIEPLPEGQF